MATKKKKDLYKIEEIKEKKIKKVHQRKGSAATGGWLFVVVVLKM